MKDPTLKYKLLIFVAIPGFIFIPLLISGLIFSASIIDTSSYKNMHYEFSAHVDTAYILSQAHGSGKLIFTPTKIDELNFSYEDSLSNVTHGNRKRFLWRPPYGDPNTSQYTIDVLFGDVAMKGDSLRISSAYNKISVYRDGKFIYDFRIY